MDNVRVGQRYGKLVVLAWGNKKCDCQCDCGERLMVTPYMLVTKRVSSCYKCFVGVQDELALYIRAKANAGRRKLAFELSAKEFIELSLQDCEYCGSPPSNLFRNVFGNPLQYNGLDRIDSSLGYVPGNVVACCKDCNFAKGKKSVKEFLDWVDRITRHQQNKINLK